MDSKLDRSTIFRNLPLLWLSLAFIAGIVLATWVTLPPWVWALLAAAAAAGTLVWRRRLSWMATFALVAVMVVSLGALRLQAAQPTFTEADLAFYNDDRQPVEIQGIVEEPPVHRESYIELRVRAEQLIIHENTIQVNGLLLARTSTDTHLAYGDRVRLFGQLVTPEADEDFSYRDYLSRQGVHSLMPFAAAVDLNSGEGNPVWAAIYGLRQRGLDTISRLYPPQEAGLLSGILLGDESGISETLRTAFNDTGTRHIIAISGFNITIIAGVFLSLARQWLDLRRGIWLAGAGVALYTVLVGAEAGVVRAAIMGLVTLLALYSGRQGYALNTLAFAAAVMALLNPLVLWDVGFQLSFAATLGLVLFAEPIRRKATAWLSTKLPAALVVRLEGPLADYLYMTIAAQVTTLPLLLFYFQRLSLVSIPANMLILPVQPAVMMLGGLSILISIIAQPLAQLVAFVAVWPITYTLRIVEFFAGLPLAFASVGPLSLSVVLGYYALLVALYLPGLRAMVKSFRIQPIVGLGLLAAVSLWTWSSAFAAPDGMLHLVALDVDGEALLVRTPAGRNVLINAGPSPSGLADELGRALPYGQQLDWLIVAGRQPAQIGALADGLERLSPSALAWAAGGDSVVEVVSTAQQLNIPVEELQPGHAFDLGERAKLSVLSASDRGAVLLLEWRNFSALFPLGLNFEQMEQIDPASFPAIDLYVLAEGGYPPLNPVDWVLSFSPNVIWAVSNEVPAIEGLPIISTADHGWLHLTTDGRQIWLESAK